MPNRGKGEGEGGRQMEQRIGGDTYCTRKGGCTWGRNLQNSKEYFRNRITTTSSIDRKKVGPANHHNIHCCSLLSRYSFVAVDYIVIAENLEHTCAV